MEITEVETRSGQIIRRVRLADMDDVEFRQYSSSRHACRPFDVEVAWPVPLGPNAQPSYVQARGHRILKSGALGVYATKQYWNSAEWPAWITSAVEASRPTLADLEVTE